MKKYISIADVLILLAMLFFVLDLAYRVDRHNFTHLIFDYTALFGLYLYVLYKVRETSKVSLTYSIYFWLFGAVILRGVLLFSAPNLSEDIYRFIWDGRLTNLGINPFDNKPSYYFNNQLFRETLTPELYTKLNSKNYFTVYPPVCQSVFYIAVWLFPKSIFWSGFIIKFFLFLCEIGTLILMYKMLKNAVPSLQAAPQINNRVLIYALNPLITIELCGNAHFEAAMIFFFLLAIFFLNKIQNNLKPSLPFIFSAVAFALSIASKMLPLMLSLLWIRLVGFKKSVFYGLVVVLSLVLMFLPLFNGLFIQNISSSIGLYFQKFEFNASIYYIYSHIEKARLGYNPITQISTNLNILIIGFILFITFFVANTEGGKNPCHRLKRWHGLVSSIDMSQLFEKCLWILTIYFLCAAVVHPWYLAFPLALSVFTRYNYMVIWSLLIPLTYIHYSYPQPTENFWVIGFEYLVVFSFLFYEMQKRSQTT